MPHDKQGFVEITEKDADIYKFPEKRLTSELKEGQRLECVIGDLHANAMKLIWFLVREGVITNLDEKKFNRLKEIFQNGSLGSNGKLQGITRKEIEEFNSLIEEIEFNPAIAVKLIGDDICDRAGNDYFVLKILSQLSKKKVPLEILLSNHSIEFIDVYEKSFNEELMVDNRSKGFFPTDNIGINFFGQAASSVALRLALEDNLISKEEISALYDQYKKNISALSYSLLPDGRLVIYSHAPINLDVIKLMAVKVEVEYSDATALELAKTIDRINEKVKVCAEKNEIHTLYTPKGLANSDKTDAETDPFIFLMWNRNTDVIPSDKTYHFVHGHTVSYRNQNNVTNLDNAFGKKNDFNEGTYTAVTAINTRAPQLIQTQLGSDEAVVTEEQLNHDLTLAVKSLIEQINAFEQHLLRISYKDSVDNSRFISWADNFREEVRQCFLKEDSSGDIKARVGNSTYDNKNFTCKKAKEISPDDYKTFETSLTKKLKIDDPMESSINYTQHRKFYKVVLANIAIALTGIGAILLAAHAIHDRVKKGSNTSVNSALFFAHTRREKMRDKMESTFEEIKKHVPRNGRQAG